MATKRRRFTAQFKAKVATEALRGRVIASRGARGEHQHGARSWPPAAPSRRWSACRGGARTAPMCSHPKNANTQCGAFGPHRMTRSPLPTPRSAAVRLPARTHGTALGNSTRGSGSPSSPGGSTGRKRQPCEAEEQARIEAERQERIARYNQRQRVVLGGAKKEKGLLTPVAVVATAAEKHHVTLDVAQTHLRVRRASAGVRGSRVPYGGVSMQGGPTTAEQDGSARVEP